MPRLLVLATLSLALAACGGGGGGGGGGGSHNSTAVTLSSPIQPGNVCATGGYAIDYGIDDNGNGVLDSGEVDGTANICNGPVGYSALVKLTSVGPNQSCVFGGTQVDVGFDDGRNLSQQGNSVTGDGILQADEIRVTNYLCANGSGVSEGAIGTPVLLAPGVPFHGKVAAGGTSYYNVVAPAAGLSLIGLTRTDSDLKWTLYSDPGFTVPLVSCDNHIGFDDDERCMFPLLAGTTVYYLAVQEKSNIPNLMDVTAGGSILVASDGFGRLFQIDPDFGDLTYLATTGLADFNAMSFAPKVGKLFGARNAGKVDRVNPFAGSLAELTVSGALTSQYTGIATHPTTGDVYVLNESECSRIFTFTPASLTATIVTRIFQGVPVCNSINGGGLPIAFDGSDALFLINNENSADELYVVNPDPALVADSSSLVGTFGYTGFSLRSGGGTVNSMAIRPEDGTVFVTTTGGDLGILDMSDATALTVNYVATPAFPIKSLAFIGGGRPPDPPARDLVSFNGCSNRTLTWRDYPRAATMRVYWGPNPGIDPANALTYAAIIAVVRADADATYDFTAPDQNLNYYFRIVPVINGTPGAASPEISSFSNC